MEARDIIDLVLGAAVAAGVLGFMYVLVGNINSTIAATFFSPIQSNWGTILTVILLGGAMAFIIPKLMEMTRR